MSVARFVLPLVFCVLSAALGGPVAGVAGAEDSPAPYPRSDLLTGVEWDWSTFDKRAPGSDIWPITWADDGNQYAAWGDGGGFGGDNRRGRVPLGVARISGDWRSPHFENVWGGDNPESPATFGGKSFGIISVDGVLFMWWSGDQSDLSLTKWGDNTIYNEQRIAVSTDHGRSWELLDWKFTREQLVGCATFVNCGQDNSAAPDRYVYSFLPRLQRVDQVWFSREGTTRTSEIIKPGRADLARVPTDRIHDRKAYEFFAGISGDTQPMWTEDPAQRKPVFQDPRGVRTVSCTYNPGLDRYLLANMHTKVGKLPGSGNLSIFESRNPWGPWQTVVDQTKWGSQESGGPGEVIGNLTFFFAPKWISEDGAEFTLIFTDNDHYGSVRGRFVTSER